MSRKMNTFERALIEAVEEGLLMLGESGRDVIYFRLQHYYALKKEGIPENLEIFVKCLREIFGSGAEVIERAVIRGLYSRLGINYEEKKGFSFFDYLNGAKAQLKAAKIKALAE